MATVEVVMPKMGESIMEGTVLKWHKKPGDAVELDEILLEIATDKVDSEIPAPEAGVLKEILVEEGDTVDVGTPIAVIDTSAESGAADSGAEKKVAPDPEPVREAQVPQDEAVEELVPAGNGLSASGQQSVERRDEEGRFYSPLVRSIAEKEGISKEELASIEGSGKEGRVTKKDVLQYLEDRTTSQPDVAPRETASKTAMKAQPGLTRVDEGERVEIVEMDRMRQIIAEHMVRSKATSPHVTSFAEVDVTNLVHLREKHKESFQKKEGVKLTFTPFFVQAAVDALRHHPHLNASVDGSRIIIRKDFHVGIAVAIGKTGLVVPIIRNAGDKNLVGLVRAVADLAERARSKKLQPEELQGGTFTVTNVGSLGSIMGTPIISQPQVAILATGAIKKRPVVLEDPNIGDVIAIRHMMYMSLSYDHRIIDGAMAASFLRSMVQYLEEIEEDGLF